MTEERKEKYANFLDKVSEILGLNKPVDVLKLCSVTDEYFKPIEKRIAELEKENTELSKRNAELKGMYAHSAREAETYKQFFEKENAKLIKAKEIIKDYMIIVKGGHITVCSVPEGNRCINVLKLNEQAEQFLGEE